MKKENKIKVYLQYPWKFPDSPYYKSLISTAQKEIEYLNARKQKGVITNKKFFWFSNFLKRNIRRGFNIFKFSIPNAHLTRTKENFDLIHCAHCLSLNQKKPWIADIESAWQLYVGKKNKFSRHLIRKILNRKNCKKILPWTQLTAKEIIQDFPEISDKIEVVYPAIPMPSVKKRKHKGLNLVFIARYFEAKGGQTALDVMNLLTKKYANVRGIIVSEVPKEIVERYSENKKIEFFGLMPQEELMEKIYPISDIFVYPGYSDSFGFAYLEAMSFGIPTVTVDGTARKEIIKEGKTGFVLERPEISWANGMPTIKDHSLLVKKLAEKVSQMVQNERVGKNMSKNCLEEIKSGKFSIKERDKKLKRVYQDALKDN